MEKIVKKKNVSYQWINSEKIEREKYPFLEFIRG